MSIPQGNLTSGVGLKGQMRQRGQCLRSAVDRRRARERSCFRPGSRTCSPSRPIEISPAPRSNWSRCPNANDACNACSSRSGPRFDFIFIDCPPSLGLLTLNALVAADAVLIPLHCEYFALEGLADLVGTMRRVRGALNPRLDIEGVVLTMYDDRTNLGQLVARDVSEFFKEKVFNTIIPRNVRLGEAPSHGLPAILYDAKSRGAAAYTALAQEMLGATSRLNVADAGTRSPPMIDKRPALGKGLSALIPDVPDAPRTGPLESTSICLRRTSSSRVCQMDDARLEELAQSIRANGIIQPILVRRSGDTFRIIAGERRWRAAQRAGLQKVPVVVRDVPDGADKEAARAARSIENVQRENLNPIDEALAYQRLADGTS